MDDIVEDPATAEALKPWYRQFCKRPCFHDEYLQAFNRPNVSLVDTDGRGVDAITSDGVVVGEREYQLDCLIYATGFEVGTDYTRRAGYDVVGSRDHSLSEHWRDGIRSAARDARARLPQHVRPGPHPGRLHGQLPPPARGGERPPRATSCATPSTTTSPTVEATARGRGAVARAAGRSRPRDIRAFQQQCTPGYYNNEGQPAAGGFIGSSYGRGPMPFFELLAAWREAGTSPGWNCAPRGARGLERERSSAWSMVAHARLRWLHWNGSGERLAIAGGTEIR